MPKPKGVQNKLKMLELALKSKILYVVWMWAKTGRGNPPNKPFEYMYLDTQIDLKSSAVLLSLLLNHNFLGKITWKTFQNIILSYPTTVTST